VVRDLLTLLHDKRLSIRSSAAKALGFCAQRTLLRKTCELLSLCRQNTLRKEILVFVGWVENAVGTLEEEYWGGMMCKGWLSHDLDDSEGRRTEALREMQPICQPLIRIYQRQRHPLAQTLRNFVEGIRPPG
jgi:hypothetical protein